MTIFYFVQLIYDNYIALYYIFKVSTMMLFLSHIYCNSNYSSVKHSAFNARNLPPTYKISTSFKNCTAVIYNSVQFRNY